MKGRRYPAAHELATTYAERRRLLLLELRFMRLTNPARRIVKHQQKLMRKLRFTRNMGVVK